jgi:hypothetical protein
VRAATGLRFTRILDVTGQKFAGTLGLERGMGRPVAYLHLALHATADGIQFFDGFVDGNWLSERLFGVSVMLLGGCETDNIGDWLGVVPQPSANTSSAAGGPAPLISAIEMICYRIMLNVRRRRRHRPSSPVRRRW